MYLFIIGESCQERGNENFMCKGSIEPTTLKNVCILWTASAISRQGLL